MAGWIVVGFIQTQVLLRLRRWVRTVDHNRLQGRFQGLRIMRVGTHDRHRKWAAGRVSQEAPLGAGLAPVRWVLADLIPQTVLLRWLRRRLAICIKYFPTLQSNLLN